MKRYNIPGSWPRDFYEYGAKPIDVHWTAYPNYAYAQFFRNNPDPSKAKKARRNSTMLAMPTSTPYTEFDVPPSSFPAQPVPWAVATNAGPFTPDMYPYGQGGRPVTYALANRSRGGLTPESRDRLPDWYFLKPESRGWPAGDPSRGARDNMHAMEVVRFMNRGFGNRSEYPRLIAALASRYPVTDKANSEIWSMYQAMHEGISSKAKVRMPTVDQLMGRSAPRSRANPKVTRDQYVVGPDKKIVRRTATIIVESVPGTQDVVMARPDMNGDVRSHRVKLPRGKTVDHLAEGIAAWEQGALIQNALPWMSVEDREFLISGITPDEWREMFKESYDFPSDED